MTKRFGLSLGLILGLVLGAGLLVASASGPQQTEGTPAQALEAAAPLSGQTTTLLADGRLLVLGGESGRGLLGAAAIRDPHTTREVRLKAGLKIPRAGHSATVLPDGTVLILGGLGVDGTPVGAPELFDPNTETFSLLPSTGLTPRAYHTATVVTSGQVVVAGGIHASGMPAPIEIYDPLSQASSPLRDLPLMERRNHTATLLPNGRVLLEGGTTASGQALDYSEVFDPERMSLTLEPTALQPTINGPAAVLEASLPEDGASDVATGGAIALRFSRLLNVETVTSTTVTLEGPHGAVASKIVAAEAGRLGFITPASSLLPRTSYTVTVRGATDRSGISLPETSIRFTTGAGPTDNDEENWVPNGSNFNGDWQSHRPDSPWRLLPSLQAPAGVTALAGQALTLNGRPLTNVTLAIEGVQARTDRTGRFLLSPLAAGHHELLIDGRSANKPQKTYGIFEAGVNVIQGVTTALPYTIWMPKIDMLHAVRIASPTVRETIVTTPLIPGLEVHLPAGTVILDRDGLPVTQVSITPIPVDRPPFPLPTGIYVPIYFTIQPGGAYVYNWMWSGERGARLIYPNYRDERPGTRANFWHYDPEERGWYVYGQGTVEPNGRQVVPDVGVAIYEFTGAMITVPGLTPPATGPAPGNNTSDGEPVDLGTGLFVLQKTDLALPDVLPLVLTRTYRQGDTDSRPFGIGATHPYAMFLWSANQYEEADLILPDGGRVHYVRISAGTGFADAVFEHTGTPTAFYKSRIAWNGNGWNLTLKDGNIYVFGENAPLQSIRDRYGNTLTLTRTNGQLGNITRIASSNGRWIEFTYDTGNRITQAKDNAGRTVAYTYDPSGRLSTVTDAKGGVTTYTYDTSHRLLTITDARQILYLTNEYDANGRVIRQTQADNGTYQFAYTLSAGKVTQTDVTDPRGNVRRVTFNADGYTLTDTRALGTPQQQTLTFERQAGTNLILSLTDAFNRRTAYAYDSLGNLTSVTRLAGTADAVTSSFTYEPTFNQVASITDPLNHTVSFTYDTKGNLTDVADPLQNHTTLVYNSAGQPVSVTDPMQQTVSFTYDGGDLAAVTDPLGRQTRRFVDAAGRLVSVTNALGQVTRYEYDSLNQVTRVTDPGGNSTLLGYDPNGNLLSVTDARQNVTSYAYDNMDRLTTRTDPLLRADSLGYDAAGNVTMSTDRRGKVTAFTYDPLNRRTFAGFGRVLQTYESTINYTFDSGNRLTQTVDSVSGTITNGYDGLDRLLSQATPQGSVSYTYDAVGRRTGMTVAGQPNVTYAYDAADRLTGITQGSSTVTFTYDAASRRSTLGLPNGVTVTSSYDAASRLTGLNYTRGGTLLGGLTYTYDVVGKRVQIGGMARTGQPPAVSLTTYDAANELRTWGASTLTYDANGNLLSDGTNTYTWDARNQLASITGGAAASFQYDAFGRRTGRTVNGTTLGYLLDGANPVQELTGGVSSATLLTGLETDEYFTRTDGSGTRTFLADALGSTVALADAAGVLQTQYTYEAFGRTTSSGVSSNTFQYTGRENDGTGLYYYRARYYNPQIGRFLSEDPIGFDGSGVNLYAYVGNDPINMIDPLGLTWESNWNYFWDWALGRGPRTRPYGPNDLETQELMDSPGINDLRDAFNRGGCKSQGDLSYGTIEAYWDTIANPFTADWSSTAAEVGGLGGVSIINNGNGTATYTIPNTSGTYSFFLHLIPDRKTPTGPMSNIYQTFQWTEPLSGRNCGCQP